MALTVKRFSDLTSAEVYEILRARAEIFSVEQGIRALDADGADYDCLHLYYTEQGRVIAYLRAQEIPERPGVIHIGRVLTLRHRQGLGRSLMQDSLQALQARCGCHTVLVDAQLQAVGFYEKMGFQTTAAPFTEAGILHVPMQKTL